ncbi:MAG: HAMP domain-containing histidine kinase [Oscillospiraceae bacterium]|nr:HAMP domain-containing histidine kinase [Oscillospiraceae bacterium]
MRFRQKMLLVMVWLLTLSYGIGGVLLIRQSFQSSLDQAKRSALSSYEMTLQTVQLVNLMDIQQDFSSIRTALQRMDDSAQLGLRLSQDGEAVYERGMRPQALSPIDRCVSTMFTSEELHVLQLSAAVRTNTEPLQLDILYDVSPIFAAREAQLRTYHSVFLLLLLLGGGTAWLTSWLLTLPLSRLGYTAKKLGSGKLDARVRRLPKDEVGELGSEFNRMADRLTDNITELQDSMERQEQFMGSFAHELKTPMTSIIGYADLLRSQSLEEEDAQDAVNYIFSEGKRLESLSLKLLDLLLIKHQNLTLVPTEMGPMIDSLVSHLRLVYEKNGITLQSRCAPGVCRVEPDLFRSVLTNLLDNARKALPEGGNICVTAESAPEGYRIRVLDNGRGMPAEALKHLTEAFYRVDKSRSRAQGGVGLGLTLCSRILDLHDGTIAFASREGNGTCVTVCLPEVKT